MPTGTSRAVSTSPAIRSLASQDRWYSRSVRSPGTHRSTRATPRSRSAQPEQDPTGTVPGRAALAGGTGPVPGHDLAQPVVVEAVGDGPAPAGHGLGGHHGVHDGLLGGLDDRVEQRVDALVGQHLERHGELAAGQLPVAGREGEEDVAAGVLAGAAGAGHPQPGPLGQAVALVREQGGVGGGHDDDRPAPARARRIRLRDDVGGSSSPTGTPSMRRRSRRPWLAWNRTPTVQPPSASSSTREAVPTPPLKPWQIMPVPPPTLPSGTGPGPAASIASTTCSGRTCMPSMSFRVPSQVSPT